jgi:hypothetical protein
MSKQGQRKSKKSIRDDDDLPSLIPLRQGAPGVYGDVHASSAYHPSQWPSLPVPLRAPSFMPNSSNLVLLKEEDSSMMMDPEETKRLERNANRRARYQAQKVWQPTADESPQRLERPGVAQEQQRQRQLQEQQQQQRQLQEQQRQLQEQQRQRQLQEQQRQLQEQQRQLQEQQQQQHQLQEQEQQRQRLEAQVRQAQLLHERQRVISDNSRHCMNKYSRHVSDSDSNKQRAINCGPLLRINLSEFFLLMVSSHRHNHVDSSLSLSLSVSPHF